MKLVNLLILNSLTKLMQADKFINDFWRLSDFNQFIPDGVDN